MGKAYGVSVGHVRGMAKQWKGRADLADPEMMSQSDLERWLRDVLSWDLCDHLCGDLASRSSEAAGLVRRWIRRPELYFKRSAFVVMAQVAVHDKKLDAGPIEVMLSQIVEHADDPMSHVRQAASWAPRSIGKRDATYREATLSAAVVLLETEDATKRWVGRDAMQELEGLIKVPERGRLLNSKSSTGAKQGVVAPTRRR